MVSVTGSARYPTLQYATSHYVRKGTSALRGALHRLQLDDGLVLALAPLALCSL